MSLISIIDDVLAYVPVVEQIVSADATAKASGASTLQIVIADGQAVAQMVPAPVGDVITAAIDVTEEVVAAVTAIKALTAKANPVPATPAPATAPAAA